MTLFRMRASTLLLLALPPCLRASWPEGKVHPWHQEIRDAMDAEAGIDRAKLLPPEDAKGLLEDALKMARESNLSATETEAVTSALYRIEKQMNETWVDPRAELEDLEVKEEL